MACEHRRVNGRLTRIGLNGPRHPRECGGAHVDRHQPGSLLLGNDAKREAAHPLKRVLTADEVASAAAYLLSPHAARVTAG